MIMFLQMINLNIKFRIRNKYFEKLLFKTN